ncbi:MAG: hypothetical protein GY950_12470 [bacterium]|nr:hypothetical protein [bacterium]
MSTIVSICSFLEQRSFTFPACPGIASFFKKGKRNPISVQRDSASGERDPTPHRFFWPVPFFSPWNPMKKEARNASKEELFKRYRLMYGKNAEPPAGKVDTCGQFIPDADEDVESADVESACPGILF